MEAYDYEKAVRKDIMEYLRDHYAGITIGDRLREKISDDLWVCDSVTGNASGSYTFNTWQAEENLCHNWDLLRDAIDEFGGDYDVLEKGAEACDVTIRCYLVGMLLDGCIEEHNEAVDE